MSLKGENLHTGHLFGCQRMQQHGDVNVAVILVFAGCPAAEQVDSLQPGCIFCRKPIVRVMISWVFIKGLFTG